jgi:hypothetical protein
MRACVIQMALLGLNITLTGQSNKKINSSRSLQMIDYRLERKDAFLA